MKINKRLFLILVQLLFLGNLWAISSIDNLRSLTIAEGLSNNTVYGVVQGKDGFVWISTDMGISRYDGYRFRNYPFINKTTSEEKSAMLLPQAVAKIEADIDGLFYLRLLQGGIACFDTKRECYLSIKFNSSFDEKKINSLCFADKRVFYLGTSEGLFGAEINYKDKKGSEIIEVLLSDTPLVKGQISQLCGDGLGNLFFCLNEKEIVYYLMGTRQKKDISSLLKMEAPVSKLYVNNDYVWVCSKRGELGCYDYKRDTYRLLTQSDALGTVRLSSTYITDIIAANNTTYYISTGAGVFRLRFDSEALSTAPYTIECVTQHDNFPIDNKMMGLMWEQSRNVLWIGTSGGGVILFSCGIGNTNIEERKHEDSKTNRLVLSDLWVSGKQTRIGDKKNGINILNSAPNFQSKFVFRGEDNDFCFYLTDFQFGMDRTKIIYRLLPDEVWETTMIENGIRFNHLQAGEYILQVKKIGNNGTEGEMLEIPIVVEKYWWCSTWAIGIYILLATGLITGLFYILLQRAKKKILTGCQNEKTSNSVLATEQVEQPKEELRNEEEIRNIVFTRFMQELRTPLSLVISPLKEMMQEKELSKGLTTKVLVAYRNSIGMLNSCDQLLGVYAYPSKRERVEIAPYNIIKVVDTFVFSMNEFLRVHPIEFQYEKKVRKDLEVWIDKKSIELALQNMLANAFAHVRYSGAVALILQEVVEDNVSYCSLSVVDNGRGQVATIEELGEDLDRLSTADAAEVELGFAVMKDIMKWHHGNITLENLRGGGTKVQIKWPIDKAVFEHDEHVTFIDPEKQDDVILTAPTTIIKAEEVDGEEEMEDEQMVDGDIVQSERVRKTILVVEDYKDIRLYLKTLFEKDYNVLLATNGEEGINLARKELPDLIICDIMMPVMDGYECCKEIKNGLDTCHIPFVLLTAKIEDDDVIRGLEMGADDYILKPFVARILKVKVKNLIEGRVNLKKMYTKLLVTPPVDNADSNAQENKEAEIEDPFISTVVKIIEENILEPDFNVKKLASDLNMSQPTLYRKVKQCTDFTIIELIRGVRMRRAAMLLKKKQYPVQEVAEMVGYNDIPTFRKHFVDTYGYTPSTYADSDAAEKK